LTTPSKLHSSKKNIWQVQEYDDARKSLLFLVSTKSALLRQPESQ
jgi:hypothetical protein